MIEHDPAELHSFNDWLDDQEDAEVTRQQTLQAHYAIPLYEVVAQGVPDVSEAP